MNFTGYEVADSEARKAAVRAMPFNNYNYYNTIFLQLKEQVMRAAGNSILISSNK